MVNPHATINGRTHGRTGPRSFALIDIVVATVLLGISVAVTMGLVGRALASQTIGERLSTAAMLADEQLQLVLARGPDDYQRRFSLTGACEQPFADYSYALTLTGGSSVGEPYAVTCTISWGAAGGSAATRSISVETRIAPRASVGDADPDPERAPTQGVSRTAEQ